MAQAYVITNRKAKLVSKELEMMRLTAGNEAAQALKISEKEASNKVFSNGDILFIERAQFEMQIHLNLKNTGRRNKIKLYTLHTKIRNADTGKEFFNTWNLDTGEWDNDYRGDEE